MAIYLLSSPYALLMLAFALDLCIGDPSWAPHPVRLMGKSAAKTENTIRRVFPAGAVCEKLGGLLLVIIIAGSTFFLFHILNSLLLAFSSYIALLIMVYLLATTLAVKCLVDSARSVADALTGDDIKIARERLKALVGRDTNALNKKNILKAAIESLAENASDGIIAPIFYFTLGGLPLAMTYKAINTLDSMVGYKNEKYLRFGWAAARLDDIVNYIPARITGILIVLSSAAASLSSLTAFHSLMTMLRDGKKHPSPNSGMPEAAMAGALGIMLGGPSTYGGMTIEKSYLGKERMDSGKTEEERYLKCAEKAISIILITALSGLAIAVLTIYWRQNAI